MWTAQLVTPSSSGAAQQSVELVEARVDAAVGVQADQVQRAGTAVVDHVRPDR